MNILKKLMLSLGIAVASETPLISAATADPDFSHPRKVIEEAYKELQAAAGKPDAAPQRVRALLEICSATLSIDGDSIGQLISLADELAAKETSTPARALMQLAGANLLNNAYQSNRWTYDRLDTPDEPLPEDITEWNGRQFRARIALRADQAFATACEQPSPLSVFASSVDADQRTLLYYPTVADFVALGASELLESVDNKDKALVVIEKVEAMATPGSSPYYGWMLRRQVALGEDSPKQLLPLYLEHRDDEFARTLLCEIAVRTATAYDYEFYDEDEALRNAEDNSELVDLIHRSLERFPNYWDNNALRNALAQIMRPTLDILYPMLVCPGRPFDIEMRAAYASDASVKAFKINPEMLKAPRTDFNKLHPALSATMTGVDSSSVSTSTQSLTLPKPGLYLLLPEVNGAIENPGYFSYKTTLCTPYIPVAFSNTDEQIVAIADFATGAPVSNVRIMAQKRRGTMLPVGTTDKQGLARFRLSSTDDYEISAVTPAGEKITFGNRLDISKPWHGKQDLNVTAVSVLPNRAIYHPGDTVQWAVIVDTSADAQRTRTALDGAPLKVVLFNANHQTVDTVTATSDAYGRAYGSFSLPVDGLTGNYSIRAFTGRSSGYAGIMVADYKMPVFEIVDVSVERDTPGRGEVSIKGCARTFSGMPVADATVTAAVSEAMRWRWWQPGARLGNVEGRTDADGRFALVVPADMLKESLAEDFSADITVTSSSAETATTDVPFTTGRPYLIQIDSEKYLKAQTRTPLPVTVYDANGRKADIELHWRLVDKVSRREAARGTCRSLNAEADLDRVRGGYYLLEVEAADSALAASATSPQITVYNVELNSMPADLPLLVAVDEVSTNAAGRASFQYGVGMDDTWLYAALCVESEIVEVEVHKRDKGFRHLSLDLPEGSDRGVLKLYTVRDGRTCEYSVDIRRPARPQLAIEGGSFRDRLVPGAHETWQLNVRRTDGGPIDGAAMVATMYNHSLDALAQLSWPASFVRRSLYPTLSLSTLNPSDATSDVKADIDLLPDEECTLPAFRYLFPQYGYSRRRAFLSRATGSIMIENSMKRMAVPMEAEGDIPDMMVEEVCEDTESAEMESAGMISGDLGSAPEQPKVEFREAEVAEAFWMPDLTAGPDGSVEMAFQVPDANTTWRLKALAWTHDMEAGDLVRDIVANKPVMVQPNLPRFLRQGDTATLIANVFNNGSETATLHASVEIFDPSTGRIIAASTADSTVAASASYAAAITVNAPADAVALGYRVSASDGRFSDGEQTLIPIESAQCDVVESTPFYLNPGDAEFKMKIPSGHNASHTLQYCSNPSWTIVKALPGLVDYNPSTSTDALYALYAACTAKGLVDRVPGISEALGRWTDADLTSRLEQNDALKIATLRATPWVQAAQSETERMVRLRLLLDPKRVNADIKAAVKVLKSLAGADGGFRWGRWSSESSYWATTSVLHTLGLLRMAGDMPADAELQQLMSKALAYMDKQMEHNDDGKAGPDMGYAVVRSLWKDTAPSAYGQRVLDATLQDCIKTWRKASTSAKANMAILLSIYDYKRVAADILSSVGEFAVSKPSQGVSFPSVQSIEQYAPMLIAYGSIDPTSSLIDGMRQWLVVRQQATTDLGAWDASQLIGAFLNSGTPWHTDNAPAAVTLRGEPVNLGDALSYGAEATVALGQDASGAMLRILPAADVPSYGAVISSYRTKPQSVKAASIADLSIEKRMVLVGADGSTAFTDDAPVPLGSRVRVLLTLHVGRDMQYVTVVDERAACLEPVDQLPGRVSSGGAYFYRENRDASTNLFISYLPKGTYQISYDCTANNAGTFAGGLATIQSALAPALTAHSAGSVLKINEK